MMMSWDAVAARINGPAPAQVTPNNRGSNSPFVFSDPAQPIERLSDAPARKLRNLIELRNSARASLAEIADRQNALQQVRFESERALASIIRLHRMNPDTGHPAVAQLRERIERAELALEDLEPFCASRTAVAAAVSGIVSRIERFLAEIPYGVEIMEFDGPPPKLGKELAREIEKIRAQVVKHRNELNRVALAPLPVAAARELLREQVSALVDRGKPDLGGVFTKSAWDGSRDISWPVANADMRGAAANLHVNVPDAIATMAWLFPDQMLARLEAEIDKRPANATALTDEARNARISQLAAEMLDLERTEEAAICAAETEGHAILRRADASPIAVLGLSSSLPAPEFL